MVTAHGSLFVVWRGTCQGSGRGINRRCIASPASASEEEAEEKTEAEYESCADDSAYYDPCNRTTRETATVI